MDKKISISEALKEGWNYTKEHIGFLIGYQLILYFLIFIFGGQKLHGVYAFTNVFGHTIGWLLISLVKMGFYNSALLITLGIKPNFEQLYSNWRLLLSWIIASFFFALMIFFGLLLLIVPGLYLWARFGLFPFFILDKDLGPIEALKETARATKGHVWDIFLLLLTCMVLDLLGLMFFGIGIFITAPITLLAMASVYRKLTTQV